MTRWSCLHPDDQPRWLQLQGDPLVHMPRALKWICRSGSATLQRKRRRANGDLIGGWQEPLRSAVPRAAPRRPMTSPSIADVPASVTIGVDTHKHTHFAAPKDQLGRG